MEKSEKIDQTEQTPEQKNAKIAELYEQVTKSSGNCYTSWAGYAINRITSRQFAKIVTARKGGYEVGCVIQTVTSILTRADVVKICGREIYLPRLTAAEKCKIATELAMDPGFGVFLDAKFSDAIPKPLTPEQIKIVDNVLSDKFRASLALQTIHYLRTIDAAEARGLADRHAADLARAVVAYAKRMSLDNAKLFAAASAVSDVKHYILTI